jgi:hypothetical protein
MQRERVNYQKAKHFTTECTVKTAKAFTAEHTEPAEKNAERVNEMALRAAPHYRHHNTAVS